MQPQTKQMEDDSFIANIVPIWDSEEEQTNIIQGGLYNGWQQSNIKRFN